MSNITLSFEKDGSDRLTHNVPWGRKGTQNGIARILGYQVLFLGRLPGDHFMVAAVGCARGITMKGCTLLSDETSKEKRYQKVQKLDTPTMTRYKVARIGSNSMKLLSDK